MECIICTDRLTETSPLEEVGAGDPNPVANPVVTPCGHLFHSFCLLKALDCTPEDDDGNRVERCQMCQTLLWREDLIPFLGSTNLYMEDIGEKREALEGLEERAAAAEAESKLVHAWRQSPMSFVTPNVMNSDATCFACEATDHLTRSCQNPITIRFLQTTGGNLSIPYVRACPSTRAGVLVSRFDDFVNLRRALNRQEYRCLSNLWMYEAACVGCGGWECIYSPPACTNPRNPGMEYIRDYYNDEIRPNPLAWRNGGDA